LTLNYVCPGIKHVNEFCAALSTQECLTPQQTKIIDVASENPPCNQGYVLAFARDAQENPIRYNFLTGSYKVTNNRRAEADNAIAIQAGTDQKRGNQPGALHFDGAQYQALPSKLSTDFLAVSISALSIDSEVAIERLPRPLSLYDDGSRLVLLTLNVLAGMQNPAAAAFIDFWNSAEEPFSTSVEFICWAEYRLDQISQNMLAGNLGTTYGSMVIESVPNCPIPGACPPLTPYYGAMLGAIQEYRAGSWSSRKLLHDGEPRSAVFQPL